MAAISRKVGSTSVYLPVFIPDATVSTGAGLANISASSVNFSWARSDMVAISSYLGSTSSLGSWSVSSMDQYSSTSSKGWYGVSLPNGLFISGNSAFLHIYNYPSMAPVPILVELTATDNQSILAVNTSTMTTPVGVSSASVNLGISSAPILLGVSTLSVPVGVSSASVDFGVSTLAVAQKLVGVSTIAVGEKLVGVSTLKASVSSVTGDVQVSSMAVDVGVSTIAVAQKLVGISSAPILLGVSTLAVPVGVSSASVDFGVSTIAVAQKLVGVSTIAVGEKLVGVSTIAAAQKLVGVSTVTAGGLTNFFDTGAVFYSTAVVSSVVYEIATNVTASVSGLVGVSTITTPVGVSSASVNLGISSAPILIGVSTLAVPVGVSSASVDFGVSTIAVAQKLVGVSTLSVPVGVSSYSRNAGVSTVAIEVGVSTSIMVSSNVVQINADATSAAQLAKTTRAIGRGTVDAGSSVTSIITSAFVPLGVATDQFKGRIITFDADTTTTALRGQSTDITANTGVAAPVFTVTALTDAPVSGDTFSVT